ncbi:MAG TPA: xanthine dehydrogenase family protein subunit M [Anaerolineales bacterium]|nr:xanthine dehydrogenase family protein subunit M [Anaerolineales bacterium]HMR99614.1 xanthine dehydrogenase family protein subunit M [Anaerolineales bacterium]HNQ95954.1 xanthine dehydrogenase family protein subunit M [Anaerolineales bacterium]HNS62192.1 xanthine dehydrogenase family protein subunit M [Anaerolineales bacterium]
MKPAPFEYHSPSSIEEILTLKSQYGDDAKFLAGGQSLVPAMNFRIVQPSVLIDLNRVSDLSFIREDGNVIRVGSMARERHLEFDASIEKRTPLLHEAVPSIAHPQIRNRGTIGGSIVNADPAAELPVLMIALNARLKAKNKSAERWLDAKDFFAGMFTTALESDEALVEIELPFAEPRTGWSFMEVAPRSGDYAMMGVATSVTLDENGKCKSAKLVYLNAGDGPVDAVEAAQSLVGEMLNDTLIESAALHASEKEITPFGNIHASAEFQRHLAKTLTMKTLKIAAERATKEN